MSSLTVTTEYHHSYVTQKKIGTAAEALAENCSLDGKFISLISTTDKRNEKESYSEEIINKGKPDCRNGQQRKTNCELKIQNLPRGTRRAHLFNFLNKTIRERGLCERNKDPIIYCRRPRSFYGNFSSFIECASVEDANQVLSLNGILFNGSSLAIRRRNHQHVIPLKNESSCSDSSLGSDGEGTKSSKVCVEVPDVLMRRSEERYSKQEEMEKKCSMLQTELDRAKALIKMQEAEIIRLSCPGPTPSAFASGDYDIDSPACGVVCSPKENSNKDSFGLLHTKTLPRAEEIRKNNIGTIKKPTERMTLVKIGGTRTGLISHLKEYILSLFLLTKNNRKFIILFFSITFILAQSSINHM